MIVDVMLVVSGDIFDMISVGSVMNELLLVRVFCRLVYRLVRMMRVSMIDGFGIF